MKHRAIYNTSYLSNKLIADYCGVRNFNVVGFVGETSYTFSAQGIFLFLLATGRIQKGTKDSDQRCSHSESIGAIRELCATSSSRQGISAY